METRGRGKTRGDDDVTLGQLIAATPNDETLQKSSTARALGLTRQNLNNPLKMRYGSLVNLRKYGTKKKVLTEMKAAPIVDSLFRTKLPKESWEFVQTVGLAPKHSNKRDRPAPAPQHALGIVLPPPPPSPGDLVAAIHNSSMSIDPYDSELRKKIRTQELETARTFARPGGGQRTVHKTKSPRRRAKRTHRSKSQQRKRSRSRTRSRSRSRSTRKGTRRRG